MNLPKDDDRYPLSAEQLDCVYMARKRGFTRIVYVRRGYTNGVEFGTFYTISKDCIEGATHLVSKICDLGLSYRKLYKGSSSEWYNAVMLPLGPRTTIRNLSEILYGDWDEIKLDILE